MKRSKEEVDDESAGAAQLVLVRRSRVAISKEGSGDYTRML